MIYRFGFVLAAVCLATGCPPPPEQSTIPLPTLPDRVSIHTQPVTPPGAPDPHSAEGTLHWLSAITKEWRVSCARTPGNKIAEANAYDRWKADLDKLVGLEVAWPLKAETIVKGPEISPQAVSIDGCKIAIIHDGHGLFPLHNVSAERAAALQRGDTFKLCGVITKVGPAFSRPDHPELFFTVHLKSAVATLTE